MAKQELELKRAKTGLSISNLILLRLAQTLYERHPVKYNVQP